MTVSYFLFHKLLHPDNLLDQSSHQIECKWVVVKVNWETKVLSLQKSTCSAIICELCQSRPSVSALKKKICFKIKRGHGIPWCNIIFWVLETLPFYFPVKVHLHWLIKRETFSFGSRNTDCPLFSALLIRNTGQEVHISRTTFQC